MKLDTHGEWEPGEAFGEEVTPISFVFKLKLRQYREFEATHIENVVRSELGLPLREIYGELNDNHIGNVIEYGGGTRIIDFSKQRKVTIGRDKSYNYKGKNHYRKLKSRTTSNTSFDLRKYTDATKYN